MARKGTKHTSSFTIYQHRPTARIVLLDNGVGGHLSFLSIRFHLQAWRPNELAEV